MYRLAGTCLLSTLCLLGFAVEEAPSQPNEQEQEPVKRKARGFLGIAGSPFDGGFESTVKGYKVEDVWHGSTADQMSIRVGDVILAINGSAVTNKPEVTASLKDARIDDAVQVTLYRKGKEVNVAGVLKGIPNVDNAGSRGLPAKISKTRGVNEDVLEDIARLRTDQHNLAQEIAVLNQQLRELPKKIQSVSEEFKKVFPQGKFEVDIKISVSSDATAENPIQLGPHKGLPEEKKPSDQTANEIPPAEEIEPIMENSEDQVEIEASSEQTDTTSDIQEQAQKSEK